MHLSILEGELAQTITEALLDANVPYELSIPRQEQQGERPPDWPPYEPWHPETITVQHKCQGFIETYSDLLINAGVVSIEDRKIVVLKPTLPIELILTDIIIAQGKSYTVLAIAEDPAGATIELRARS